MVSPPLFGGGCDHHVGNGALKDGGLEYIQSLAYALQHD